MYEHLCERHPWTFLIQIEKHKKFHDNYHSHNKYIASQDGSASTVAIKLIESHKSLLDDINLMHSLTSISFQISFIMFNF